MTKRNRSISYQLSKRSAPEKKAELLHEWAYKWHREHIDIVERLKNAIDDGDINQIRINLGELRAVTNKKHDALHNIFDNILSAPEE